MQETAVVQKHLGGKGFIVYLVLLSAFVPMSTDLYLPALPSMTKYFNVPEVLTNLTIVLFFVFYSAATLVWGPLSDKHGRRPVLLTGLIGYAAASFLCALSPSVYMLIAFRILQAVGAAAAAATATAIAKDVYEGKRLERTIAAVQTITVIVPVAAPMLGALLLRVTDWRGAFFAQAILGVVVVILTLLFTETIRERNAGGVINTLGRLIVVLRNTRFTALLMVFCVLGMTYMAFLGASSYIYQDIFKLSQQTYSYFFSLNAAMMFLGPLLYIRLSGRFSRFALVNAGFVVIIVCGVLVCSLGRLSPWAFAATLLPTTIASSFIAPPSRFLMLSQVSGDSGSASSLMGAVNSIFGSIGITVTSLGLGNHIVVVGGVNIVLGLLCGGAWIFFTSRPFLRDVRR